MSAELDKENYRPEQNKEAVAEDILDRLHQKNVQFPTKIQSHDKQLDLCEKELEKKDFNKTAVLKELLERFTPKEESTSKKGKVSPKENESTSTKEKSAPMEEGEVEEDPKKRKRTESEDEVEQSAFEEDNEGSKGKGKAKAKGRARGGGGRRRKAAPKGGKRATKRKAVPASPTKPGEVDTAGRKRRKAVWKTEIVANEANRAIVEEMNDLSKRYYKEGDTGRGGKYAYASKVFRHTHHPIGKNEDTSKIYGIGTHIDKDVHEVQKEGESHRLEELEEKTEP